MNKRCLFLLAQWRFVRWWTGILLAVFAILLPANSSAKSSPWIRQAWMEKGTVIVITEVPVGAAKVTLESRSRFGAGTWVPRAVARPGTNNLVTFRVPASSRLEVLRVRIDSSEPLPSSFYAGTNDFNGQATPGGGPPVFSGTAEPGRGDAGATTGNAAPTAPKRDVVESDLWKVDGATVYFFNQFRGLQVIDVSQPNAPKVTGLLPLPAAGEQMYLLDQTHLVLLARDGCGWGTNGPQSKILIVEIKNGVPVVKATLPLPGNIQESRLVGMALYVASQAYRQVPAPEPGIGKGGAPGGVTGGGAGSGGTSSGGTSVSWEWGSAVSSFDLADPARPVTRDTSWFGGYGNAVMATDRFLFVATSGSGNNWWQSQIQVIDISSPDGTMQPKSSILPAGQVIDKFKMDLSGDAFTVISQARTDSRGLVTRLETFSLRAPESPQKLGRLELAAGEQLHATRFDGRRVYVVTFFRKDPLWVVDLSDPTQPHIAGELQVPGWSTYIEPLGDGRLVTVGIDNTNSWRVAVSLFDVKDAAHPALLSKVPLGENYSWSEATSDEKAFNVLADAGLVLVPYQGYSTNGYASRVQLIDLAPDSLKLRGVIEHAFQPRRTAFQNGVIFSISGQELLVVDAANRDLPAVRADLALAWPVDRVIVQGQFLIEISTGSSWDNHFLPIVRVTPLDAPNQVLAELDLTNGLPVLGAVAQNQVLYLAQGQIGGVPILQPDKGDTRGAGTNAPNLVVSAVDLGNLPQLKFAGQTEVTTTGLGWNSSLRALFPHPDLLVWVGGGSGWVPWLYAGVAAGGAMPIRPWPWYGGGNGGRLWAFRIQGSSAPRFFSEVDLTTNSWWSFSNPFTSSGLVYMSHQSSKFIEGVLLPGQTPPPPTVSYDKGSGRWITNQPPIGIWVQQYFLDAVDYADPKTPTIRPPVNIPGVLSGVSHAGAMLYTTGFHWDAKWNTDWSEYLDAAAYDGVHASLVDSMPLPKEWPHPTLVQDSTIFIGRPGTTNLASAIESWSLSDSGKFSQTGKLPLAWISTAH